MSNVPARFRAFTATQGEDRSVTRAIVELGPDDLGPGDVTIAVEWSSVNFKDGLASIANGRVARISPLVPGIDLAGTVLASDDPRFAPGDRVLANGYDIGVAHHGGYAEVARLPAGWVVPQPEGLSARQAMAVGTAGFTAAMSVDALERLGLAPGQGPVLVTGATGGVGSVAVGILAGRGYEVWASTGKADAHDWLRGLGAHAVLDRAETSAESPKPLESERWAGCVDCVGGTTLAYALRTMRYGASVAASGLTGGHALNTTVMPFILRGVNLLGIDSANLAIDRRIAIWQRVATDLRPQGLDEIPHEVDLDGLPAELDRILAGGMQGRAVVRVGAS